MSTETPLRPARRTPNFRLPVPGDAAPHDIVTDLGNLADALDALADRLRWQPGDLKFSASDRPGPGWLPCDGRAVTRAGFPELFDAIGVRFGGGDGSTTFNLPDFRGRMPIGVSESRALGQTGGAERVTLGVGEMPHHAHGGATGNADRSLDHLHNLSSSLPPGWYGSVIGSGGSPHYDWRWGVGPYATGAADRNLDHLHGVNGEGGGQSHENLPPFAATTVFIKT